MIAVFLDFSKYINILLLALFVLTAYVLLKRKEDDTRQGAYAFLEVISNLLFLSGMASVYIAGQHYGTLTTDGLHDLLFLIFAEFIGLFFFQRIFFTVYPEGNRLLFADMKLLISVGFIILARINIAHASRQAIIIAVSMILFMIIPVMIRKLKFLKKIYFLYGIAGAAMMGIVLTLGSTVNGSKLSYMVFGLSFQASEFAKLLFAFFIAGILAKVYHFGRVLLSAIMAGIYVLILVASKDLGSALIFFVMYVAMVYVATGKKSYVFAGVVGGEAAAVAAYFIFSHVQTRVRIWLDPWADIDGKGYQLTQSLFAIGTGGWFGMGLGHGTPSTIPYVEEDFIFSAISEECGALFAVLVLLVFLNIILCGFRTMGNVRDPFYRIVGTGYVICLATQVFLTVGGGTRLIPLTGVTLPLISNGGSSGMATILLFSVLQGISMIRMDEIEEHAEITDEAFAAIDRKRYELEDRLDAGDTVYEDEFEAVDREERELIDALNEDKRKRRRKGKSFVATTVFNAMLYIAMIVNISYFVIHKSEEVITNSYNAKRLEIIESEVELGNIYAHDGSVLAQTLTDGAGNSYRDYPYGEEFAHVVGYASHGRAGLERDCYGYLLTSSVSLSRRTSDNLSGVKHPGDAVYTTLEPALQEIAYMSLGIYRGAVIATEVDTGRILCMASTPDFDPNEIDEIWDSIVDDKDNSILVNRATQGLYPPGSTFKIFTALEYIRENPDTYDSYHFNCTGSLKNGEDTISCFHHTVHGSLDLTGSFARSCNSSFANIGLSLNRTSFATTLTDLYFNREYPVNFTYNPSRVTMEEGLSTFQMMQTSIGQSTTAVTPLYLNMVTAAIANNGEMLAPYLVDRVESVEGSVIRRFIPQSMGQVISKEECEILTELMCAVVEKGTGTGLSGLMYTAAGKTGSAEFSDDKTQSHAWFTGFAPAQNPKIAVTVIMENAGTGGDYAVPVARRIFTKYFETHPDVLNDE